MFPWILHEFLQITDALTFLKFIYSVKAKKVPNNHPIWIWQAKIPVLIWSWSGHYVFVNLGPHILCGISEVVPFNMWLISSWEENNCCYIVRHSFLVWSQSWYSVVLPLLQESTGNCHVKKTIIYLICNYKYILVFLAVNSKTSVKWMKHSESSSTEVAPRTVVFLSLKTCANIWFVCP